MSYPADKFPWHLTAIGLPALWDRMGNRGEGIRIGLIDSGVNSKHPELQGAHISGGNVVGAPADINDQNGHGTACASLLVGQGNKFYGVCPDAELVVAKIYDDPSEITLDRITRAVEYLVKQEHVQLVSLSLGVFVPDEEMNARQPEIQALETLLAEINNMGILLVSTIGNYGSTEVIHTYPAAGNHSMNIGAYDIQNRIYSKTPVGSRLDILAPGVDIDISTAAGGYDRDSGTSYAVPVTAGVIALVMKKTGYTSLQAGAWLKNQIHTQLTSPKNHKSFLQLTQNNL